MATPPPPAKLKACLTNVKEKALPDDSSTQDTSVLLIALVFTELVQRGVVAAELPSSVESLWDTVRSTAGRALLDASSGIPNPLLAASSAVAGMVAERSFDCLSLPLQQEDDEHYYKSALERCREVGDERLESLLLMLQSCQDHAKTNLLIVAEGFYLRAASFQPDPPQMWKRALDVIFKRNPKTQHDAPEAALPLQQLIRVATNKGNSKRVSELTLRLAESLLSTTTTTTTTSSNEPSHVASKLVKAYCIPYRQRDQHDSITQAREALKQCDTSLLEEKHAVLRFATVALGIEMAAEAAAIQQLAQEQCTADKNRSQVGSSESSTSLDTYKQSAREQILVMQSQETNNTVDEKAIQLRDSVVSTMVHSKQDIASPRMSEATDLVRQQVERLQDRARAIAVEVTRQRGKNSVTCTDKDVAWAWSIVSLYVFPIVECLQQQFDNDDARDGNDTMTFLKQLPSMGRRMVESAATACVSAVWNTSDPSRHQSMHFVMHILSNSLVIAKTEMEEHRRMSGDVVKSNGKKDDATVLQLQYAHASAMCLVAMAQTGDKDILGAPLLQDVTEQAIAMSSRGDQQNEPAARFGTDFLQCMVCWSGFHCSPWPFCNVTQARAVVARARKWLKRASVEWGRLVLPMENMLLNLAEADAEGGLLVGGFVRQAGNLYRKVLEQLEDSATSERKLLSLASSGLVKTHCLNGLARIALQGDTDTSLENKTESGTNVAESLARDCLKDLEQLRSAESSSFYMWTATSAYKASVLFHVSVARQLVADSLLRASRSGDAQCFLEDAVRDAPFDFDAALALGAFRLRMVFFCEGDGGHLPSAADEKVAQIQLLKAAKLDSTKADPFSLLGLWYEKRGDVKRAVGCYSKALLLEPPHPVAGRGMLRLKAFDEVKTLCDAASNTNSPLNGWAWRALGQSKAMVHGDDDLAIVCFQKALRCRDVECPRNESLGVFYSPPPRIYEAATLTNDLGGAWAELAGCYRRLGRYSAAVRAFESASEASGGSLPSSIVCSWAQVELELGLHDEAAEKFAVVLTRDDAFSNQVAAYGQGMALLALARRDAQDGKGGRAFEHLKRGVGGLLKGSLVDKQNDSLAAPFVCALKLLGDLYSFGAWLPPDVFVEGDVDDASQEYHTKCMIRSQIAFVTLGEVAYRAAKEAQDQRGADEPGVLEAPFICDHGTNKLLQAQLLTTLHGESGGTSRESSIAEIIRRVPEVREMFDAASKMFERAIEVDPLYPPSWCGLGCAVCGVDPLLSQHSFCRALQLDKTAPDVWANLGFLYATHNSMTASSSVMDALTQVADSPMMWIGRALLLEQMAFSPDGLDNEVVSKGSTEDLVARAADAYRASLQVMKHPSALLGLAMTCRMAPKGKLERRNEYTEISQQKARVESFAYMSEFLDTTGSSNAGATALGGAMTMEAWVEQHIKNGISWNREDGIDSVGRSKLDPAVSVRDGMDSRGNNTVDSGIKTDMLQNLSMDIVEDSSTAEQEEKKDSDSHFSHELSISRQIVHDPDDGQLWLQLAKDLSKELVSVSNSGSPKRKIVRSTFESAMLAASRSAKLLTEQLFNPKILSPSRHLCEDQSFSQSSVPRTVDAHDVSDALSLTYWVEKVGSELFEDVVVSDKRLFELQRALIICPSNKVAREALKTACTHANNCDSEDL